MKFIYFEEWNLKEKILAEGIHLRPNHRKINEESTGIFCYPMLKIPFKVPVAEDHYDYLAFKKEEEILNELFTIEESWEIVGASRVRKGNKNVLGVIFEMELKHWPITVFINIHSFLANEFGQILCDSPNVDIFYYGQNKNSFLEFIKIIELKNYFLQSVPFTVNTEDALLDLINILQLAGGGIWKEDSFECMIIKEISNDQIQEIIELNNRHHTFNFSRYYGINL